MSSSEDATGACGSAALKAEAQRSVLPPITGIFSITITCRLPFFRRGVTAATQACAARTHDHEVIQAPVFVPELLSLHRRNRVRSRARRLLPALLSVTHRLLGAAEVTVAPETLSTLSVW